MRLATLPLDTALLAAASGCVTIGFAPQTGTAIIPITATDSQGNSQTANLILTVTP